MTLNQVVQSIKKHWKIALILFLLLVLASALWERLRREEAPITPPEVEVQPLFGKLPPLEIFGLREDFGRPDFTFSVSPETLEELPQKAKVFRLAKKTSGLAASQAIAEKFGFGGEPEVMTDVSGVTFYHWSNGGGSLLLNTETSSFSFSQVPREETGKISLTASEATDLATTFLKEKGLWENDLEVKEPVRKVYASGFRQVFEVSFGQKIEDRWILGPDPDQTLIRVSISLDGVVEKVEYFYLDYNTQGSSDYPLLSFEEAAGSLERGKGTIASLDYKRGEYEKTPQVLGVTINKVDLAYYGGLTPQEYLQPIFVLSGQARTMEGKMGEITIYLPAVASE